MNVIRMRTGMVATAFMVALAIGFVAPTSSQAGCLKEFGECGECVNKAMAEAFREFDIGGMADAYVDAIDCDIDLIHCLLYAHHHDYVCSV